MGTFIAVQNGPISAGATWGNVGNTKGTHWPGDTDDAVFGTYDLTQGSATQLKSMTGSTGCSLTFNANFVCHDIYNVPLILDELDASATLDFGDPDSDAGCRYSGTTGRAVSVGAGTILGVTSGKLTNSGGGTGIYIDSSGSADSLTLDIVNSNNGKGIYNAGSLGTYTGTIRNTTVGYGIHNISGFSNFIGKIINSSTGIGLSGGCTSFTGELLNLSTGVSFTGVVGKVTGAAGNTNSIFSTFPADCLAANIKSGKTILDVAGSLVAGGGGSPLVMAGM